MNAEIRWFLKERRFDVVVTLSRRNLRTLLLKIADPDSRATISRDVESGFRLVLVGESDETHYAQRSPGPMVLWTEAGLQAGLDGDQSA